MPAQDTSKIKEKILFTLRRRGPCLPVHIANEIETSILFASAFLSELVSEKKIRMSHMRVGSSPLYFLPGQEYLLEKFSQHLQSRERDAFELLKNNKFLVDSQQDPAIRVALRSIRDFAIPFRQNEEIIWRYPTAKESEFKTLKPLISRLEPSKPKLPGGGRGERGGEIQKPLDIFGEEKPKEEAKPIMKKPIKKTPVKKITKKTSAFQRKNEKFFNKVKEFLSERSITISDIEGFSKTDLILTVIERGNEKLLIAYNKKRITEADLLKAHKKSLEYNLPYIILSLGDPPKKLENLIDAIRKLSGMDKINE